MPRTRIIPNENLLNATVELVSSYGVSKFTFASLSQYTGLSPATLVQRFGTKRQLLNTVARHCLQSMVPSLVSAQTTHTSSLQAVLAAFSSMAKVVTSVEAHANGQVFFYLALTDTETNRILRESMTESLEKIREMLDEAVQQKELRPCDTNMLAHLLQTTYEGAITTWLIYQQEDAGTWVKNRLEDLLMPYKVTN